MTEDKKKYIEQLKYSIRVHRCILDSNRDYCSFCESEADTEDEELFEMDCECITELKKKLKEAEVL